MTCKLCNSAKTSSFGIQTPHVYCHTCGGHEYEGQLIDRKTWDAWVNGLIERPERIQQLEMFKGAA